MIILTDSNACNNGSDICGQNATCRVSSTVDDGYMCVCNDGFEYDEYTMSCILRETYNTGV